MKSELKEYLQMMLMALVCTLIVFVIIDLFKGRSVLSFGSIVEKQYREERFYVTISNTVDSKGHVRSHPVYHHDPPEWKFFVENESGEIVKVESAPELYYHKIIGSQVEYRTWYGGMTDIAYSRKAVK